MENIDSTNQQFGDYQLVHMLSHNELADVYLGRHVRRQTLVAIKRLHGRCIGNIAKDFQRQYSTVARLQHPHILTILDYGIADETAFVVTAYASKGTLRQHHPKNTRVAPLTVLNYVQQISQALAYVHDQGLVHRDTKPQNILVDEQEHLLLADFGTMVESYSLHPGHSHLREFEGTVLYAAPEQLQGMPRRRSDQYALAIMVYEWLCGTWPFTGTFHEVAHQHLFVTPPPLAEKGYPCPPNIERVIFKALEKDPAQRFGTIKQFADELEWALKVAQAKGLLEPTLSTQPLTSQPQEVIHPDAEQPRAVSKPPVQPRRQFKVLFSNRPPSILGNLPASPLESLDYTKLIDRTRNTRQPS
jgi:serine/threonine protein kinase